MNRRANAQIALNRRMGGAAAMDMLQEALDAAQQEHDELLDRYDEAVRRIDHAESIAAEADQYRITDARTKLERMKRHQVMLDSRLARIQEDVARAEAEGVRFDKPALPPAAAEHDMFLPAMAERLLLRDKLNRSAVESLWPRMVCPKETVSLKQMMKELRRASVDRCAPVMSLITALVQSAMKEV